MSREVASDAFSSLTSEAGSWGGQDLKLRPTDYESVTSLQVVGLRRLLPASLYLDVPRRFPLVCNVSPYSRRKAHPSGAGAGF